MYGLKYYVRITRFEKNQYENPFDFGDIQPYPNRIHKGTLHKIIKSKEQADAIMKRLDSL